MAKLLGLGSKKTVALGVVEHHALASKSAFSLFDETLAKLSDANTDIEIDIEAQQQEIDAAEAKKKELLAIQTKNEKLRSKIAKFVGSV